MPPRNKAVASGSQRSRQIVTHNGCFYQRNGFFSPSTWTTGLGSGFSPFVLPACRRSYALGLGFDVTGWPLNFSGSGVGHISPPFYAIDNEMQHQIGLSLKNTVVLSSISTHLRHLQKKIHVKH